MTLICPVAADAAAGHHVVHLGLTGVILVAGSVLLARGYLVFRATAPRLVTRIASGSQSLDGGFSPSRGVIPSTDSQSLATTGR